MAGIISSPFLIVANYSAGLLADFGMLDQLYECTWTTAGYDQDSRKELLREAYDAVHRAHTYESYTVTCAILFFALAIGFFGIYLTRFASFVFGAWIGVIGALLLDGLFLPRGTDARVNCADLEATVVAAAFFTAPMMLMFRKSLYLFFGLVAGEVVGASFYDILSITSPVGGVLRHSLATFCALCSAYAMYAFGDLAWVGGTALLGAWSATHAFVEVFLVVKDPGYNDFLRYSPDLQLFLTHPYVALWDVVSNPHVLKPILLAAGVAWAGGRVQMIIWENMKQRSVNSEGDGSGKNMGNQGKASTTMV